MCLKHFARNDSEYQRHSRSSIMDARTLHETYLRPFQRAVRETGAWRDAGPAILQVWYPGQACGAALADHDPGLLRGSSRVPEGSADLFGHGLGYTRFAIEAASVEALADATLVRTRLRNVGGRDRATILQIYAGAPGERLRRPPRELCAFRRVALTAGEAAEIELPVPSERLACFDPASDAFVAEEGAHRFEVGFSCEDLVDAGTA